ncbi:hypothetical protein [Rhodovulum sp. PH10]|uniref:hypothetical protein n=1 Tax=Rhodovulum sp. PH10 TaxID=1187851 RepID=UPI001ED97F66|nr:hypothetical protein [Rhodovulum sp. PH10]
MILLIYRTELSGRKIIHDLVRGTRIEHRQGGNLGTDGEHLGNAHAVTGARRFGRNPCCAGALLDGAADSFLHRNALRSRKALREAGNFKRKIGHVGLVAQASNPAHENGSSVPEIQASLDPLQARVHLGLGRFPAQIVPMESIDVFPHTEKLAGVIRKPVFQVALPGLKLLHYFVDNVTGIFRHESIMQETGLRM